MKSSSIIIIVAHCRMVWGGTFWVAAFVAAAAAEASADQPSRQVPAAFQFSGAPLLRSGPSHVSLVGDRLGISERVLLGSSLNPSLSRQARLVGYSFAGPKRFVFPAACLSRVAVLFREQTPRSRICARPPPRIPMNLRCLGSGGCQGKPVMV